MAGGQRRFVHDSPLEGDGFELPVPRKLGLRRGRRLALHLGSLTLLSARPRLERDQAAPGFGEEGEHCRRVIKRRATASKAAVGCSSAWRTPECVVTSIAPL